MPKPTAKPRAYSDAEKASVMAALLTGQSVSQVAAEYRIPAGTVKAWKAGMTAGLAGDRVASASEPTTKKSQIGELLVDYLAANLAALKAQVEVFRDPTWLRQQTASDAAVLHGVMTDKAVRLLEALGGPDGQPAP